MYTGVLLQKMRQPGLKIEEVFKATRVSVIDASGGRQTPWDESSITNDFYFAAGIPNPAPVAVVPVAKPDGEVTGGSASVLNTKARLKVTTNAPKAIVTVDGVAAVDGAYSVNLLDGLSKSVEVRVTASGYEGQIVNAVLERGKLLPLSVTLEAIAAPVVVAVPSAPVSLPPVARKGNPTVNPKDGAELVLIPAGPFLMGDDKHTVTLPTYSIYKNLVTVGMYKKFCKATKRQMPYASAFNEGWSKKDHPIVNVTWADAKAYCDWAGAVLPSEAQWEKAARGTEGRKFPWGGTFDTSKLWCSTAKLGDAGGTTRVGSFAGGASPYGVLDMAGNVWQWCNDWYDADKKCKALHGGSWNDSTAVNFRCAVRGIYSPDDWIVINGVGFRCVLLPAGQR